MDIYNSAATMIQTYYRGFTARKTYQQKKTAATKIQSNFRGYKARKQISEDMDSGTLDQKKKKKKGKVKYAWNKMKHCWTKITGKSHHDHKAEPEQPVDNELWELSQKPELPPGEQAKVVEEEDDIGGYKVPHGKTLTLLQLQQVYTKKHKEDPPDEHKIDPLTKYGAPQKSPYESAYGKNVTPYVDYQDQEEENVPRKPHKVIKYVSPTPPKKQEEEPQGFLSMFKRKEVPEGAPKEESILDQMGGKFMGLFHAKPGEEAPKQQTSPSENSETKPQTQAAPTQATPGMGDKFMGLFSAKTAETVPAKPQAEAQPQDEEGFFGKIGGLFKPKPETSAKPKPEASGNHDSVAVAGKGTNTAVNEEGADVDEQVAYGYADNDEGNYDDVDLGSDEDEDDQDVEDEDEQRYSDKDEDYSDRGEYEYSEDEEEYSRDEDEDEDERSYDDDDEEVDGEPASKAEFQLKFMSFLKMDTAAHSEQNPARAAAPSQKPADLTSNPKPGTAQPEQSGMDKMFGFFKKKT